MAKANNTETDTNTNTDTRTIVRVFRDYLDQPRWVEWETRNDDKVPLIGGSKRLAKTDRPDSWRTLAQCPGERKGIVFNGDGLGGIDLDGCRYPETGTLTEWAADLVKRFDSYSEVSPSGTGVKIYLRGCPAELPHNTMTMPGEPIGGKAPQVEAYVTGRYFTATGEHLAGTSMEIREVPAALAELMEEMGKAVRAPGDTDMRRRGRNGALFSIACQNFKRGLSPEDVAAVVNANNRKGNVELHEKFAEGPIEEREVAHILKSAERKQRGEEPDRRPRIQVRAGELHQQVAAGEDALAAAGAPVFTQDNQLVRFMLMEADAGRGRTTLTTRITPYERASLLVELARAVRWVKYGKDNKLLTVNPPREVADGLLGAAYPKVRFSELVGIIETPTLRPDGSIVQQPGYDPATGLMLVNPPPMPAITEAPTREDAERALALLDDLLCEFPFVDEPSHAVALSAMLTTTARAALGFAPIHAMSAPGFGEGKSYLGEVIAAVAVGRPAAVVSLMTRQEEAEKRLHGEVLGGAPLIVIDNHNDVLTGTFLSQLVTQSLLSVRRLGQTGSIKVKNTATVLANGENIEIGADLVRRTLKATMSSGLENPTAREFKSDPVKTVLADRGRFVAAALTAVRAHQVAGCPGAKMVKPLAGFNDWSRLVRGALVWLGYADPVETQEQLRQDDPKAVPLDLVMETWAEALGKGMADRPMTVRKLLDQNQQAFEQALRSAVGQRDDVMLPDAARVGEFFARHQGRVRRGMKLEAVWDAHRKQQTWQLVGWREFLERQQGEGQEPRGAADKVVTLSPRPATGKKATRKSDPPSL